MDSKIIEVLVGHQSERLSKPTVQGHTHRWTLFVRPANTDYPNFEDNKFVSKVKFKIHESFPVPLRIIKDPPFSVTETGYASFSTVICVYLNLPGQTSHRIQYELNLSLGETGYHDQLQKLNIKVQIPKSFQALIAKYCAKKKNKLKQLSNSSDEKTTSDKKSKKFSPKTPDSVISGADKKSSSPESERESIDTDREKEHSKKLKTPEDKDQKKEKRNKDKAKDARKKTESSEKKDKKEKLKDKDRVKKTKSPEMEKRKEKDKEKSKKSMKSPEIDEKTVRKEKKKERKEKELLVKNSSPESVMEHEKEEKNLKRSKSPFSDSEKEGKKKDKEKKKKIKKEQEEKPQNDEKEQKVTEESDWKDDVQSNSKNSHIAPSKTHSRNTDESIPYSSASSVRSSPDKDNLADLAKQISSITDADVMYKVSEILLRVPGTKMNGSDLTISFDLSMVPASAVLEISRLMPQSKSSKSSKYLV